MADLSSYAADLLRDLLFRTAAGLSKPAALNVSLHAGDPGLTGANEVVGGSYGRIARNPGDANWTDEAAVGTTKNAADITFAAPTANWGIITHAGIFDGAGNFIARAPLAVAKTVNNGDAPFKLLAGNCTFVFV